MKKIKWSFLISCLVIISPGTYASEDTGLLNKVITKFKSMSSEGYHITYFGKGGAKNEAKFEGEVRIDWSETEEFNYKNIRILGVYHVKDILGKRDEVANIYLKGNEFWNLDDNANSYTYSPDIKATLQTTFKKSPIFALDALLFLKNNKTNIKVLTLDNGYKLTCSANGEFFTVIADKNDYSIQSISWKNENWKNSEIIAKFRFNGQTNVKDFGKPDVKDYTRKSIPTKGFIAPQWESVYHSGGKVSLDQFKGKVIVMDFWATWCPPCIRAIPSLERLHLSYKDNGVNILGLNYFEKRNPKKIMKKLNATYPTVDAETIGKEYGILNWPTTFVIDKKGVIRDIIVGYHGEKTDIQLDELIQVLINE